MKGMLVYHSFWGSCKRIAEAIALGLEESGHEVRLVTVENAGPPDSSFDFIVIGGATRWPGATRKIKRYAGKLTKEGFLGKPFATFSTGGTMYDEEPNEQASEVLYKMLEAAGLNPIAPPLKLGIEGYKSWGRSKGTLPAEEIARAEDFGRDLGSRLIRLTPG